MKELSTQEKAKAYDEAYKKVADRFGSDVADEIFTECKESYGERIRKAMISGMAALKEQGKETFATIPLNDCIDWLENEGKQNSVNADLDELVIQLEEAIGTSPHSRETIKDFFQKAVQKYMNCLKIATGEIGALVEENYRLKEKQGDEVEPKFHEGDWIVFNGWSLFIKEVVPGYYRTVSRTGIPNSYDWDIDNIARRWTIDDAKPGDMLAAHECLVLFREIDGLNIRCYCTYHFMNNPSFYVDTLQNKEAFHPATKEQEDQLKKAMADAGYTFDFDKKKFKNIEPKFKAGNWV